MPHPTYNHRLKRMLCAEDSRCGMPSPRDLGVAQGSGAPVGDATTLAVPYLHDVAAGALLGLTVSAPLSVSALAWRRVKGGGSRPREEGADGPSR